MTGDASPRCRLDPGASRCVLGAVGGDQVAAVAGRPAQRVQTGVVLALDPNQRGSAGADDAGEEVDRAQGPPATDTALRAARLPDGGHGITRPRRRGSSRADAAVATAVIRAASARNSAGVPSIAITSSWARVRTGRRCSPAPTQSSPGVKTWTLVSAAASHSMYALIGSPRRGKSCRCSASAWSWLLLRLGRWRAGLGVSARHRRNCVVGAQAGASAVQARRLMRSGSSLVSTRVARAAASSPLARTGA